MNKILNHELTKKQDETDTELTKSKMNEILNSSKQDEQDTELTKNKKHLHTHTHTQKKKPLHKTQEQ